MVITVALSCCQDPCHWIPMHPNSDFLLPDENTRVLNFKPSQSSSLICWKMITLKRHIITSKKCQDGFSVCHFKNWVHGAVSGSN